MSNNLQGTRIPVAEELIKPEKSFNSNDFFSTPKNDQTKSDNNNDAEESITEKIPQKLGGLVNSSFGKHGEVVEQVGKEALKYLPTKGLGLGIINPVGIVNQVGRHINDIRKKVESKRSGSPLMNSTENIPRNLSETGEENKDLDTIITDKLNSSMENIQITDRLKSGIVMQDACISHSPVVKDTHDSGIIHIETSVDPVFKTEQINVKFESNRLLVTGRYEDKQTPGDFVEFRKSFEISQPVDSSSSPSVQISGSSLMVEAPIIVGKK